MDYRSAPEPRFDDGEADAVETATPNIRMASLAIGTGVLILVADLLLILTYVFEVSTNGPYVFGTAHRILAALGSVLLAVLVLGVSRYVERSGGARLFVRVTVAACLIGGVALILGIPALIDFWTSSLVSVGVLIVQAFWMLWVSRRLLDVGVITRPVSLSGRIVGGGLLLGMILAGASVLLPSLTIVQLIVLGLGVFIAGGVWLAWPVWFVMLGLQLRKAAVGASAATDGSAGAAGAADGAGAGAAGLAPIRKRGRRAA